jgi:two-component system, NtrC family, sensor kinase
VEQRTLHLRQAQARLVQSQKMASLGRLVAGVAHEFNNPIGAVLSTSASTKGWIDRLERELASQPVDRRRLEKVLNRLRQSQGVISEGAERVADVVQRLTAFARLDQAERKLADLDQCVDEALGLLPPGWDREIELTRRRPDEPLEVICFPARLNQALQGLLENAVDALEGGGALTVSVATSGPYAEIVIEDMGRGIPAELMEQIFDPGFTTKSRGVGTGLGLAVAYQVMEDHDGRVKVRSEEGEGTTVTLRLPLDGEGVDSE